MLSLRLRAVSLIRVSIQIILFCNLYRLLLIKTTQWEHRGELFRSTRTSKSSRSTRSRFHLTSYLKLRRLRLHFFLKEVLSIHLKFQKLKNFKKLQVSLWWLKKKTTARTLRLFWTCLEKRRQLKKQHNLRRPKRESQKLLKPNLKYKTQK